MMRRYTALKATRGTLIPSGVRAHVKIRDHGCVGPRLGLPGLCMGGVELDHVRGSGALGKKSRSTPDNLVSLCAAHHQHKTLNGRAVRPVLIEYLERVEGPAT